jgi:hypothetical protein
MTPLQKLLCENYFYLITSRVGGESMCHNALEGDNFNLYDPYFGDSNYSVLMEVPEFVEDSSLGDVNWMSWTVAFYVAQMGQPLIDMAQLGDDNGEISDLKVSELMNDVLRLALQVSIMDGELDELLAVNLPGAHISLKGEEIPTWLDYRIFPKDVTNTHISNNPPQHQLYHHGHEPSTQTPNTASIVATAMMESHSLRHFGVGMFATLLFLLLSLMKLGKLRRKQRENLFSRQQKERSRNLQLATEDDVSVMLKTGKRHIQGDGQDLNHDDTPRTPVDTPRTFMTIA